MNDLVTLMRDEPTTTSLKVADKFEKRHNNVLRAIEKLLATDLKNDGNALMDEHVKPNIGAKDEGFEPRFWATTYQDVKGERRPMYKMNLAGFMILTMGFNGKEAILWKKKFVAAFLRMYRILSQRASVEWREARAVGKLTRKAETDTIKLLVEYAKEQGSENAPMLYVVYTRLANKAVGIKSREMASVRELNRLDEAEDMILKIIRRDMAKDVFYKDIYKNCKQHLETWQDVLMIA